MTTQAETPERAAHHIISDLGEKLGDDVSAAVLRAAFLVDHPADRACVSTLGASKALGLAIRFFEETTDTLTTEQLVDALWNTLRPLILQGAEAAKARGEA